MRWRQPRAAITALSIDIELLTRLANYASRYSDVEVERAQDLEDQKYPQAAINRAMHEAYSAKADAELLQRLLPEVRYTMLDKEREDVALSVMAKFYQR